jgi:hypothetical protein
MKIITTTPEISIGDHIFLKDEKEGEVILKTIAGIVTSMFDGEGYIRKVNPKEIVFLRRESNFFRVVMR